MPKVEFDEVSWSVDPDQGRLQEFYLVRFVREGAHNVMLEKRTKEWHRKKDSALQIVVMN